MFENLIEKLKKTPKTLVYSEGRDPRIQTAAARLKDSGFIKPIMVAHVDEANRVAKENGIDIEGIEIIDPDTFERMDEMVDMMFDLRKGKMSREQCAEALTHGNYFGTMLVKMGIGDAMLGGATYSTADTVRPALQIIKTKPGHNLVSSTMVMVKELENGEADIVTMSDCAINLDPTAEELVEIAIESAKTAEVFGLDPKVAMLSYSTHGSGSGPDVDKVVEATRLLHEAAPDLKADGEIQFDAAVSPEVAKTKCPGAAVAGDANVFIFPEINSSNMGCKIIQRYGGYDGYGPVIQGLNGTINDLSRGCNADEVYIMSLITAAQSITQG